MGRSMVPQHNIPTSPDENLWWPDGSINITKVSDFVSTLSSYNADNWNLFNDILVRVNEQLHYTLYHLFH